MLNVCNLNDAIFVLNNKDTASWLNLVNISWMYVMSFYKILDRYNIYSYNLKRYFNDD